MAGAADGDGRRHGGGDRPALALQLLRAADWFDDALRARLEEAAGVRLTRSQAHVFAALDPGGTSIAELARRVGVTRQSMHRTVGELVAAGLLVVSPDTVDRRARTVRLSRAGTALVGRAADELDDVERVLRERVGDDVVASLRDALHRGWGPPPTTR